MEALAPRWIDELGSAERLELFRSALESRIDSANLDQILGLQCADVEKEIPRKSAPYQKEFTALGYSARKLMTTYYDYLRIFEEVDIQDGDRFLDVGCAYMRGGFALSQFKPGAKYIGLEIVKERLQEGDRVAADHNMGSQMTALLGDVAGESESLPKAEFYYIYNSLSASSAKVFMKKLELVAQISPIKLIVHYQFLYDLESVNWLVPDRSFQAGPDYLNNHQIYIYRSRF